MTTTPPKYKCMECGEDCALFEEIVCTQTDMYQTGILLSSCCNADYQLYDDWLSSQEEPLRTQ